MIEESELTHGEVLAARMKRKNKDKSTKDVEFVSIQDMREWFFDNKGWYADDKTVSKEYSKHHSIMKPKQHKKVESANNGGKTDYYQLSSAPFNINDFDDFAEWRELNGNQFNMGKVMWSFNIGRHSGTDYVRDLNKVIHYANRELDRLKRKGK